MCVCEYVRLCTTRLYVPCPPGKQLSSVKKTLERVFNEAAWRQPAVVLLDDLDLIAAAPSGPEQEMAPESVYYARIAQGEEGQLNKIGYKQIFRINFT